MEKLSLPVILFNSSISDLLLLCPYAVVEVGSMLQILAVGLKSFVY